VSLLAPKSALAVTNEMGCGVVMVMFRFALDEGTVHKLRRLAGRVSRG
jgi:hypothetical protein